MADSDKVPSTPRGDNPDHVDPDGDTFENAENIVTDPVTTTGLPIPPNRAEIPERAVQPPGQATAPDSDADAKAHQRTGDPEADAAEMDLTESEDTQRVSWNLPRALVDRVKTFQSDHNLSTQSDAAAQMLASSSTVVEASRLNY